MTIKKITIYPGQSIELTEEQREELREAAKHPIVFDEDCPEMTDEQLERMATAMKNRKILNKIRQKVLEKMQALDVKNIDENIKILEQNKQLRLHDWGIVSANLYGLQEDVFDQAMDAVEQGKTELAIKYISDAARLRELIKDLDFVTLYLNMDKAGNILYCPAAAMEQFLERYDDDCKTGNICKEEVNAGDDKCLDDILSYYMNKEYQVVYEQDEDGGYVAHIPELKGCITQADTLEEAKIMIEDAKKCWLSVAIEDGIEIPEPKQENNIVYPAIVHKDQDGMWLEFPDLVGCQTQGDSLTELLDNAEEALGVYVLATLDSGMELPKPSNPEEIKTSSNAFVTLVKCKI